MRGARPPDLLLRRRPRPSAPDGAAKGRADRRSVLVLSGAQVRDAPRRRAVDRARREADAQVSEPLLFDERVFAEVLPESDHRLRQHTRRRQGDVRRLFPDGPIARTHLPRNARGPVPRAGMAEIPARKRDSIVQAVTGPSRARPRPEPEPSPNPSPA